MQLEIFEGVSILRQKKVSETFNVLFSAFCIDLSAFSNPLNPLLESTNKKISFICNREHLRTNSSVPE